MRWIFINPDDYKKEELDKIILHESAHSSQFHSVDVLISQLLVTISWINPFAWLLKKEIVLNLESLADKNVIKTSCQIKDYQYLLLNLSLKSLN